MKGKKILPQIAYILFVGLGFLFAFFCQSVYVLNTRGNILWTGLFLLKIMGSSLFFGGGAGALLCFLIYRRPDRQRKEEQSFAVSVPSAGVVFAGAFLLIVLSWLPAYLAYYPAICAYDMPIQTGQIVSGNYNDHHPIAHTLLIQGAMAVGEKVFGDVNTGIGLYGFLQLLFLAGAFAWGIAMVCRCGTRSAQQTGQTTQKGEKRQYRSLGALLPPILLLFYAMLFPFHMYMSVSVTKDTVFTGFAVLQITALCVILQRGDNCLRISGQDILLIFSTIGMILFRNNGKYAMLVLLGVLLLTVIFGRKKRKLWGRLLSVCGVGFLVGNLLLSALFAVTKAEQGDRREMLSMPIQQLARCMVYHGGAGVLPEDDNTISEEDKALIRDFILDEAYREYHPGISDPVKRHANTYVVRYRLKDFSDTYFRLFAEYPGDFVNAALAVNAGWLSPFDETHAVINQPEGQKGLGYVQTRWVEEELNPRGIYQDSKWEWLHEKMERWADNNSYLEIPVLKYIFVPGTWLWLGLLLAAYLLVHRRFGRCIPLALLAGYYGTLFLGPAVQLRYLYPVMAALPFAAVLSMQSGAERKGY